MIDPRFLHAKTGMVTLRVTHEALQKYVETIGELNPIYFDKNIACQAGFEDIPLPATYPSLFWNAFQPIWLKNQASFMLSSQVFTYIRPLLINHDYQGELTLTALRKSVNKQFAVHILRLYDQSSLVATVKTTIVLTNEVT